jgi:hypothetical protein
MAREGQGRDTGVGQGGIRQHCACEADSTVCTMSVPIKGSLRAVNDG